VEYCILYVAALEECQENKKMQRTPNAELERKHERAENKFNGRFVDVSSLVTNSHITPCSSVCSRTV